MTGYHTSNLSWTWPHILSYCNIMQNYGFGEIQKVLWNLMGSAILGKNLQNIHVKICWGARFWAKICKISPQNLVGGAIFGKNLQNTPPRVIGGCDFGAKIYKIPPQ